MNKNVSELNIPEENKILISKIEKRIDFLSEKTQDYFEKTMTISPQKIENAYSVNEDLISILIEKDQIIEEIKTESHSIRIKHQTNFTNEIQINLSKKEDNSSIINNALNRKDNFINSEEKSFVLNKRIKYLKTRNSKRKKEMEESIEKLEKRLKNDKILDVKPTKEDIFLIKSFLDQKEITKTRTLYFIPFILMFLTIILIGSWIWITIN